MNRRQALKNLAALAALAAAPSGCRKRHTIRGAGGDLVVISPHDETVRLELTRGFETYARKTAGRELTIRWQPARGTGNIMRFLENEMASAAGGREVGIDVFLGGGAPAHEKAARSGITQAVEIRPDILAAVPETLGGVHLWDASRRWYGVTISSFGIIFNRIGLKNRAIPEPLSWKDLAAPAFNNLVVMADPFESGSARACYEMILQRFGWREGWKTFLRILANTGSVTHSSSDIAREISSGQSVAGMVIDTYAYVQIDTHGPAMIGLTLPEGETTFTPDPVSVVRGTPRLDQARLFVEFLLSRDGQKLWFLPAGSPGGPERYNLWHFPVRPDVYEAWGSRATLKQNPFTSFATLAYDEEKGMERGRIISLLFETACVQNRRLLKKAWAGVLHDPTGAAAALFDEPPFGEAEGFRLAKELDDPIRSEVLEEAWYGHFKKKYLEVIHETSGG